MDGIFSVLLVAAVVFGICFLADKGFTKIFRGQVQHRSGLSVRPNKKYGAFGLILVVIGLGAVFSGLEGDKVLLFGGFVVIVLGIALVIYYLSTGLFYDEESFIYTSFGKKSLAYNYRDIQSQQLYNAQGNLMVELYMTDGKSIHVHGNMNGAYDFLDKAFYGWCAQRGIAAEDCSFHDPSNSCWFPPASEEK
jgi:hypothetical protein